MSKIRKRKRKTKVPLETAMDVAWYRPEQWDRLLEISSDYQEFEDTFEEWKVMAEENLRKLSQRGYVNPIIVDSPFRYYPYKFSIHLRASVSIIFPWSLVLRKIRVP